MTAPPAAALIGSAAVAGVLGCSVRTVQRLAESGVLPAVRAGWGWRFDPEAVAEALAPATEAHTNMEGS